MVEREQKTQEHVQKTLGQTGGIRARAEFFSDSLLYPVTTQNHPWTLVKTTDMADPMFLDASDTMPLQMILHDCAGTVQNLRYA